MASDLKTRSKGHLVHMLQVARSTTPPPSSGDGRGGYGRGAGKGDGHGKGACKGAGKGEGGGSPRNVKKGRQPSFVQLQPRYAFGQTSRLLVLCGFVALATTTPTPRCRSAGQGVRPHNVHARRRWCGGSGGGRKHSGGAATHRLR